MNNSTLAAPPATQSRRPPVIVAHAEDTLARNVALLEQTAERTNETLAGFMAEQKHVNDSLFGLVRETGNEMRTLFNELQTSIGARGKITLSGVLGVVGSVVSLLTISGAMVHWYVDSRVNTLPDIAGKLTTYAEKADRTKEMLYEERLRSVENDAKFEVELRWLKEKISEQRAAGASKP